MRTFSRIGASEGSRSAGRDVRDSGLQGLQNLLRATRVADTLRSASQMGTQRGSGSCSGGKRWMIAGEAR